MSLQMYSTSTCYVRGNDLVRLDASCSAVYLNETQKTLSLANIKFTTSTLGVAKNLYNSFGSVISLV